MNEHGKEEPVFEIGVVIPRRVVQEEDKSSDCAYVLIEEFKKVGFVVERVIGIADEFIKLAAPLETLGRAAAELQIKERTHIGMYLQFEVEEVEAFVKQPDGSVFSWSPPVKLVDLRGLDQRIMDESIEGETIRINVKPKAATSGAGMLSAGGLTAGHSGNLINFDSNIIIA